MTTILAVVLLVRSPTPEQQAMEQIAASHVDANVPPAEEFDKLMRRDLEGFYRAAHAVDAKAEYELLRDVPTQRVAYPGEPVGVSAEEPNARGFLPLDDVDPFHEEPQHQRDFAGAGYGQIVGIQILRAAATQGAGSPNRQPRTARRWFGARKSTWP